MNAEFNNILNNPSSLICPIGFNLTFTDATYDIGASGATRPRHLYLSGNAVIPGTLTFAAYSLGTWTTPTFDAGDFTASASMTWTVGAGDVSTYAYTIIGKMMTVSWSLDTTTVGGTPEYYLYLKIPAGKVATKAMGGVHGYSQAAVPGIGAVYVNNSAFGTNIALGVAGGAAWSAGTNNCVTVGQITFEIN